VYLGLALFAEGPSDHLVLRPLLRRLSESICLRMARSVVEVSEVVELHTPEDQRGKSRADRITAAAKEALGAWHVLFVHADGAGDPIEAVARNITPAISQIGAELGKDDYRGVAVVPVRETEAWALADGDALRRALGTTLSDSDLGVPSSPSLVEKVPDPKLALVNAWKAARGGRKGRRRSSAAVFLEPIGEQARLDRLSVVPAFRELERHLTSALRDLGFIHDTPTA